jgi:hypothetical protein
MRDMSRVNNTGYRFSFVDLFCNYCMSMSTTPLYTITPDDATDLILQGEAVRGRHITGNFEIYKIKKEWDGELLMENCIVDYMVATSMEFMAIVRLINCRFQKCSFIYTYFPEGLTIDRCIFETYLDFGIGGTTKYQTLFGS